MPRAGERLEEQPLSNLVLSARQDYDLRTTRTTGDHHVVDFNGVYVMSFEFWDVPKM